MIWYIRFVGWQITSYDRWPSGSGHTLRWHYSDVITGTIASQITSLAIVYWTIYSDADQRKHQSSASLAFVRGNHRASDAENISIWLRDHGHNWWTQLILRNMLHTDKSISNIKKGTVSQNLLRWSVECEYQQFEMWMYAGNNIWYLQRMQIYTENNTSIT